MIIQKLGTKAASPVKKAEPIKLYLMDLFRPRVSARNPQRCEVRAIPTNEMLFRSPLRNVSSCSSHVEPGIVILTPMVSSNRAIRPNPEAITT